MKLAADMVIRCGEHFRACRFCLESPDDHVVVLVGDSGVGKSSLLDAIAGLSPLESGGIQINDAEIGDLPPARRPISYMRQSGNLFAHLSVFDNLRLAWDPRLVPLWRMRLAAWRKPSSPLEAEIARCESLLQDVELPKAYLWRQAGTLSGGEQQRVAIARILGSAAPLMLLDEPANALQPELALRLTQALVRHARTQNRMLVMASHDRDVLAQGDRIIQLTWHQCPDTSTQEHQGHQCPEIDAGWLVVR